MTAITSEIERFYRLSATWWSSIVGAEYLLRVLPRGTHQWKRFVTSP